MTQTAHALKFAGFQDMYFNDSFPPEYGVAPDKTLANKPELLLPESARKGRDVAEFASMGADAVAERLSCKRNKVILVKADKVRRAAAHVCCVAAFICASDSRIPIGGIVLSVL